MSDGMTEAYRDAVDHPAHYTQGEIEAIDAIRAALGPAGFESYCVGNAMKYLWRCKHKGAAFEDLRKADWYLRRLIDAGVGK